ncbi:MAG: hypothetical protein M5R36_27715 [Deltaproteobacteria bacterium]|nr:hypothetical protein [Deltaproteobacteria bacterium]
MPPKEQDCHIDVQCREDWAAEKTAVGLLLYEDVESGSTLCTGSLLEDLPGTGRPFS